MKELEIGDRIYCLNSSGKGYFSRIFAINKETGRYFIEVEIESSNPGFSIEKLKHSEEDEVWFNFSAEDNFLSFKKNGWVFKNEKPEQKETETPKNKLLEIE